ncbi:MAG: hypothetical protein EOP87_25685 [Verrucomicrobiaceae bacterium]|nr:MAG: hypothetical protein EOP87_25685 [Verrucomicrobiaceae bacterium]
MKSSTVPILCGVALAAMSAAGASHWWTVKQTVAIFQSGVPLPIRSPLKETKPEEALPAQKPEVGHQLAQAAKPQPPQAPTDASQKKFYEALVSKMENLQNQNRDLLDQMAETNRDLMKLEFRVDTHSESFRPLPVSEERIDTSFDDGPGVLPPRAEPVFLPSDE